MYVINISHGISLFYIDYIIVYISRVNFCYKNIIGALIMIRKELPAWVVLAKAYCFICTIVNVIIGIGAIVM